MYLRLNFILLRLRKSHINFSLMTSLAQIEVFFEVINWVINQVGSKHFVTGNGHYWSLPIIILNVSLPILIWSLGILIRYLPTGSLPKYVDYLLLCMLV